MGRGGEPIDHEEIEKGAFSGLSLDILQSE